MFKVLSVFPKELKNNKTGETFHVYNLTLEKDGKEIPYVTWNKECKVGDEFPDTYILEENGRNDAKGQVYYKLIDPNKKGGSGKPGEFLLATIWQQIYLESAKPDGSEDQSVIDKTMYWYNILKTKI